MFKYRRTASMLLGGAALALTSIVGLSGPAQATGSGAVILVPLRFDPPGAHVLPQTFTAGDCRQVGQNQAPGQLPSYVTIQKSATPNVYTITWNATLYTISTYSGDYWHQKFVFRNANGPLASVSFDGPVMASGGGRIYYYVESKDVPITTDVANSITFVDWIGSC